MIKLPDLFIGIKLVDRRGKVIAQYREKGHSWTRNAWHLLFSAMSDAMPSGTTSDWGAGYLTSRQISGATYAGAYTSNRGSHYCPTSNGMTSGSGVSTNGIVIGTGDAAFSTEQHSLDALIPTGTSSGQMAYQAQAVPVMSYNGGTKTWTATHARQFNNNSGAEITVKEVGLYWYGHLVGSSTPLSFLVARDVLGTPVAVQHLSALEVQYEISMDFSDID